jgi:alpha-methylacyl-CoA racemase
MAGIGPAPFACMLLADMGAEVIRIERKGAASADRFDVMARGRRSVSLDLKKPEAVTLALGLI